jgi:hypothetical protein
LQLDGRGLGMEWHYYWQWNGLVYVVFLLFSLFVYFLPSIVAFARNHVQAAPIFVLNLFLGWTLSAGLDAWLGRSVPMFGVGEMVRPVSPDTDDEQYLPAPPAAHYPRGHLRPPRRS